MTAATLKPMAMAVAIENSAIHMDAYLLEKSLLRPVSRGLRKPRGNAAAGLRFLPFLSVVFQ